MNHIQRGQQYAADILDNAGHADQLLVAKYTEHDFRNVVDAGFVTVSFDEYNQRISGLIAHVEQRGLEIVTVPTTAKELLDTLDNESLPNTPDGRAAAIGIIHQQRR